jgi:glycosyltransferase involved in cell wall biosynthesis
VGGVPEIAAGSTGMEIVGAGDVDAMAERAERLIERTAEDASFRRRIRASALRRFSLERRIGVLEDVLTELAAGTPLAEGLTA